MILIIYRNATGKLLGTFQPPKGWTFGDLKREIDRGREANGGDLWAYITLTNPRT